MPKQLKSAAVAEVLAEGVMNTIMTTPNLSYDESLEHREIVLDLKKYLNE